MVVFSAAGASDPRGLFRVSVTGGAITKLIDLSTPIPGGTGTLSFDSNAGLYYRVNDGGVLFAANTGVYLVPATGGAVARISDSTTHTGGGAYNSSFGDESAGLTALTCYDSSVFGQSFVYTAPTSGLTSDGNGSATNATFVTGTGSPITPTVGGNTGVVTITITGKNFAAGAAVTLSAAGKSTLTAKIVTPDSTDATLAALFDLTGASDGLYDLTITNPDGSVAGYPASFTIEPGTELLLYADVIGRAQARGGYFQTHTILCGNRGNTDAFAVPLVVTVPSYITLEPGNFTLFTPGPPAGAPAPAFTHVSGVDPAYTRARLVLPQVAAGQYGQDPQPGREQRALPLCR